jgi:UDP-glucose 4-epimerase
MNILITGGAGYIGSHAVQRLLRDGHRVVSLDNLFRGHAAAMGRLAAGPGGERLHFIRGDIANRDLVEGAIREHRVEAVMHFAAVAYVGESVQQPLWYYRNNAAGALALIEALDATGVGRLVFSSTAATYGEPEPRHIPIQETCPQRPINPYGRSKLHVEQILADYAAARPDFAFAALRYFNVAGSDRTGLIGEHHEPETHLIPVILQAILGRREAVTIFGTDYPTPDGTCIRDYIHVEDLVDAHIATLQALRPGERRAYNLGIGKGYSVRQIIDAARRITGRDFKVIEGPRRPGDPPSLYADPGLIRRELGWTAAITGLDEIIGSAWAWFRTHPGGYAQGA